MSEDGAGVLQCAANQAVLEYLRREEKRAPYAGKGPYYAFTIRKVLKSVKECPFPLQNAEQISSLRGVGKVLSQKLLEIISGSTGESSTAATAGIPAPPQAIAARIRAEPKEKPCEKRGRLASYKPEQGKGPWWLIFALHRLGTASKADVNRFFVNTTSPIQGLSCPPLNDWWGNALKQMQNKNIIEKDPETTGSRGKEGVKYTLTSTGATMAEGLFWRDDGRSDSPEDEEDLVEAVFSEIGRERMAQCEAPFFSNATSSSAVPPTSAPSPKRASKVLISLLSDSEGEEDTPAVVPNVSAGFTAPSSHTINPPDVTYTPSSTKRSDDSHAKAIDSLSPPRFRWKYIHSSDDTQRNESKNVVSEETDNIPTICTDRMSWSPIRRVDTPEQRLHRFDEESFTMSNDVGVTRRLNSSNRESISDRVMLQLDDPWADSGDDDHFDPFLVAGGATLVPSAVVGPVESRPDQDMVLSSQVENSRGLIDLRDSPHVESHNADADKIATSSAMDLCESDVNSVVESAGSVERSSSDEGVETDSVRSRSEYNNNTTYLSLRERLRMIRERNSTSSTTKNPSNEQSSCFKTAMAAVGLNNLASHSSAALAPPDFNCAAQSQMSCCDVTVSQSQVYQGSVNHDTPAGIGNISDDYDYFQHVEDNDYWDDNADYDVDDKRKPAAYECRESIEVSYKSTGRLPPSSRGSPTPHDQGVSIVEETDAAEIIFAGRTSPQKVKDKAFRKMATVSEPPKETEPITTEEGVRLPMDWIHDWEVVLLVDIREKENATIQSHLYDRGVLCETAQLALGDFLWAARRKKTQRLLGGKLGAYFPQTQQELGHSMNDTTGIGVNEKGGEGGKLRKKKEVVKSPLEDMVVLDCIIERKTARDLAASIVDGRYREQSKRLTSCGVRVQSYIIEGLTLSAGSRLGYACGVTTQALESAMVSIQVSSGIDVQRTRGIDHTISLLVAFHNHVVDRFQRGSVGELSDGQVLLLTYPQFQNRNLKTKAGLTMEVLLASQLRQIPGCSEDAARVLARTFGTVSNLISFVNEVGNRKQTVNFIADIRRTDGKGRRLGKSLAEYIVKMFSSSW